MDHTVSIDSARDGLVRDAMVVDPKTLPVSARVEQVRELFENPRVKVALVVDGNRFVGEVDRAAAESAAAGVGLGDLATVRDVVAPDAPMADALRLIDEEPGRRLPVVDAGGALVGLVCLDASGTKLCVG